MERKQNNNQCLIFLSSEDEHITSLAEFKVQKLSSRQPVSCVKKKNNNNN